MWTTSRIQHICQPIKSRKALLSPLFTFFGLLSSSLSPWLSQRFSRYTPRPSSGGWNVELNPLFRLPGLAVLVPWAMFNGCQLSAISCYFPLWKFSTAFTGYWTHTLLGMSLDLSNAFIYCAMCTSHSYRSGRCPGVSRSLSGWLAIELRMGKDRNFL